MRIPRAGPNGRGVDPTGWCADQIPACQVLGRPVQLEDVFDAQASLAGFPARHEDCAQSNSRNVSMI